MPKGRTGLEIVSSWITGTKPLPVESQFFNPLDARIGSHVRLAHVLATIRGEKDVNLSEELFSVTEIWDWHRSRHGDKLPQMADYLLESGDKQVVLRVIPTVTRGKITDPRILLLAQHWPEADGPYPWGDDSPFILDGCMDEKGQLTRHLGTPAEEVYFRDLCNVHGRVSRIRDENHDGTVEIEEVSKLDYSLWTFRRDTHDIAQQDFTQHLHVQLGGFYNEEKKTVTHGDKTILMLAGETVPLLNVTVY